MHPHRPTLMEILVAAALVLGILVVVDGLMKNYERASKTRDMPYNLDRSR